LYFSTFLAVEHLDARRLDFAVRRSALIAGGSLRSPLSPDSPEKHREKNGGQYRQKPDERVVIRL